MVEGTGSCGRHRKLWSQEVMEVTGSRGGYRKLWTSQEVVNVTGSRSQEVVDVTGSRSQEVVEVTGSRVGYRKSWRLQEVVDVTGSGGGHRKWCRQPWMKSRSLCLSLPLELHCSSLRTRGRRLGDGLSFRGRGLEGACRHC